MMPWTSESDCTLTSYPPHLISSPILPPPLPPPCHLLHSGRAVGKKPSFFSCFFCKLASFSATARFFPERSKYFPRAFLSFSFHKHYGDREAVQWKKRMPAAFQSERETSIRLSNARYLPGRMFGAGFQTVGFLNASATHIFFSWEILL